MYLKSQLDRFADQINDPEKAGEFRRITVEIFGTNPICVSSALDAFNGSDVNDLRHEFQIRHLEFLEDEDFPLSE